jgi:hypothetical protein
VVAAVDAIINAPQDPLTVLPLLKSRAPSRLLLHARSPKILLRTLRFLPALSTAWLSYPPRLLLFVDVPAIPVSLHASPNWR